MPKNPAPPITLRDPHTEKAVELSDEQGTRGLLVEMMTRIDGDGVWRERLPDDSSARVAAQILRKADGLGPALAIVKDAETLAAIFEGTDLEEDTSGLRSGKTTEKLRGLLDEKAREQLADDVREAVRGIWPTWQQQIESTEGEDKKTASVKIEFVPESDDADAYTKVVAEMKVSTTETTRKTKVRRLRGGRWQLELFGSGGRGAK